MQPDRVGSYSGPLEAALLARRPLLGGRDADGAGDGLDDTSRSSRSPPQVWLTLSEATPELSGIPPRLPPRAPWVFEAAPRPPARLWLPRLLLTSPKSPKLSEAAAAPCRSFSSVSCPIKSTSWDLVSVTKDEDDRVAMALREMIGGGLFDELWQGSGGAWAIFAGDVSKYIRQVRAFLAATEGALNLSRCSSTHRL